MPDNYSSRERIIRTIDGRNVDRVPVMPFDLYEILKLREGSEDLMFATGEHLNNFTNGWKRMDPHYGEIAQFALEHGCDVIHRTSFTELDRRFLLVPEDFIDVRYGEIDADTIQREYTVRTPGGNLTYVEELKRDFSTTWIRKPLLENLDDVKKIMAVPYEPGEPDLESFFDTRDDLGDRGVLCCFVSPPLVCVSHLFNFNTFLLWVLSERKTVDELIETVYERIYRQLEYLLESGISPMVEFGGSEQATPPMMSPALYDELAMRYDGPLIALVKSYGLYVRVHCHGRVRDALPKLMHMGVDVLNPVEAPPSGDIEMGEAKKMVKGKITLEGNIQFGDLEFSKKEEIDELVRKAIFNGGRKHFILTATEWPITYLSEIQKMNYMQFIESGMKYGVFEG